MSQLSRNELNVGDKFPLLNTLSFLNGKPSPLKSFHGRLIILDFWNVHCAACIESMPQMEKLQESFANELQIILVTNNNKAEVNALFQKVKIKRPVLPMVFRDKNLSVMFPHKTVPHHVWISKDGVVEYITDMMNATPETVGSYLRGEKPKLELKREYLNFDVTQPLWAEGSGRLNDHLRFYSHTFSRISAFRGSMTSLNFDTVNKTMGIKVINQPLINLYKIAAFKQIANVPNDNWLIVEAKDSVLLFSTVNSNFEDWENQAIFSYESCVPLADADLIFKKMLSDLNQNFPYTAKIERRRRVCLALSKISGENIPTAKSGNPKQFMNGDTLTIVNLSPSKFVYTLETSDERALLPIIDETGYEGGMDIQIYGKLNDVDSLNTQLKKYGLRLVKKVVELDVLVIRDGAEETKKGMTLK